MYKGIRRAISINPKKELEIPYTDVFESRLETYRLENIYWGNLFQYERVGRHINNTKKHNYLNSIEFQKNMLCTQGSSKQKLKISAEIKYTQLICEMCPKNATSIQINIEMYVFWFICTQSREPLFSVNV